MTGSDSDSNPDSDSDPEILVAGETLIDFLPDSTGPLSEVENFSRRAGGAPANVAVALARLDAVPWFWTCVGEDPFGDHLAATLSEYGLPDRFVERDPEAKTALAFVSHDEDGERDFTFYRDGTADTQLEPGVPDETLDAVNWVYVGGVMLAADPGRSATFNLAERATARDCTVVFDPNARPELWDSGGGISDGNRAGSRTGTDANGFPESVGEMLDYADVVKATPEDLSAAGFDAEGAETLAKAVCERGPHTVLLTLGGAGAFAYATEDAPWGAGAASHGGYGVNPVDTTGAGDAFTAGALAAFAEGEISLSEVLGFANAVAAVTTTAPGAMTALPTREAVRDFRK